MSRLTASRGNGRRDDVDRGSGVVRFLQKGKEQKFSPFLRRSLRARARAGVESIKASATACNRTVCRERWHNIEPVCSLTLFDRRSVCFRRSTADVDRCREELEGPEQKRHHRGEGDEKASGRRASRHRSHLYYKQRETDQGS